MWGTAIGEVAGGLWRSCDLLGEQWLGHRPQHRLEHREVDARHVSGALSVPECGGSDESKHQAAHRVEPRQTDPWRYSWVAIEPGKTGIALQQGTVGHGVRLRSGASQTGGRDIDQIWIDRLQGVRAEAKPIHDPSREILDQHIGFGGQRASDPNRFRRFEVEHDAAFCLAEDGVQLRPSTGVAAAWRLDLDDFSAHRREIARRRRPGDYPAEIEHTYPGERHRVSGVAPHATPGRIPLGCRNAQAKGRPWRLDPSPADVEGPIEAAVRELRRSELFRRLAQREAGDMRRLGHIGDRLLVVVAAPR